jgi:NTE family protein
MSADDAGLKDEIGLCLSGGGFRASLFHVGSLWRLNELGVLKGIHRVSSVSGGSITSGVLALRWSELASAGWSADAFSKLVAEPVKRFCERDVDAWAIGEGALVPWRTASDVIQREYKQHLFGDAALRELPTDPVFVFNATNLQSGRVVRFTRRYVADWMIGMVVEPDVSLATVVAASSAFPPFLSPVVIDNPGTFEAVQGAIHNGNPEFTARLHLTDGGVYDNLGLEPVWKRCRTILVSDAGAPFALGAQVETDWVKQTLRALDIATDQSRGLRKRWLVDQYERGVREGAYWGIDTLIGDYAVTDQLFCDPAVVGRLPSVRTRLNRFTPEEQGHLINWGYALCDAAIRGRAPALVSEASRPTGWPIPEHPLGQI